MTMLSCCNDDCQEYPPMLVRATCAWCHGNNDISTTPTYCAHCGLRADLARIDCDCPRCRPRCRLCQHNPVDAKRLSHKGVTQLRDNETWLLSLWVPSD